MRWIIFFLGLLLVPTVFANTLVDDLIHYGEKHAGEEMLGAMSAFFGDEAITLYITLEDGTQQNVTLITDHEIFMGITRGEVETPTARAYTDVSTVRAIIEDVGKTEEYNSLVAAFINNAVRYEGVGFISNWKYRILRFFSTLSIEATQYQEEKKQILEEWNETISEENVSEPLQELLPQKTFMEPQECDSINDVPEDIFSFGMTQGVSEFDLYDNSGVFHKAGEFGVFRDRCIDEKVLLHFECTDDIGFVISQRTRCDLGCREGACLR